MDNLQEFLKQYDIQTIDDLVKNLKEKETKSKKPMVGFRTDLHRIVGPEKIEDLMEEQDKMEYLRTIERRKEHWNYYKNAVSKSDKTSEDAELTLYNEYSKKAIELRLKVKPKLENAARECIDTILLENYKYNRNYIRDKFNLSQAYISRDINDVIKALYISAPVKNLFRDMLESEQHHRRNNTIAEGYMDKLLQVTKQINLKDMLFYTEKDVAKYIYARFKRTRREYNSDKTKHNDIREDLTRLDMYLLLNATVYSSDTLRERIGVLNLSSMYEFHVNPAIEVGKIFRYETYNVSEKRSLVRFIYLEDSDTRDLITNYMELDGNYNKIFELKNEE